MKQFTRRSVLQTSAAWVAGAMALPKVPAAWASASAPQMKEPHLKFPATPRDRLSIASWPFRAEIESATNEYRDKKRSGMDLRDFAVKVRETFGVHGVEPLSAHFPSTDDAYLKGFREATEKVSVHVVNIPVHNAYSFYDPDSANRKKGVEHAKKWVNIAVILGSPSIRTAIAEPRNAKPNVDTAAESLRELVDYAAGKNVVVNLENDDLVSEDAFFVVKVIEKVNHPYLHALPDFCNSMMTGNEKFNYDAVTAMFAHAYNICHVKDSEVDDKGKVYRVSLEKTFGILKASGYKGYCSMEWEGPEDPYVGTRRLIEASLKYLS